MNKGIKIKENNKMSKKEIFKFEVGARYRSQDGDIFTCIDLMPVSNTHKVFVDEQGKMSRCFINCYEGTEDTRVTKGVNRHNKDEMYRDFISSRCKIIKENKKESSI